MGQSHNMTVKSSPRVTFDEAGDNGFMLCDRYLPAELLAEIFCWVDYNTLLNCQLVCARWRIVIQNYVWWKKAEMALGKPFPRHGKIPWEVFYFICKKKPFERNLLMNHSGQQNTEHWQIFSNGGDNWTVECPPAGVPELPLSEPIFEGKQICFATSYYSCTKRQIVDLVAEGIHPHVLDEMRPPIEVSEWYSCRWDCPAVYEMQVELLKDDGITAKVIDKFEFRDTIQGEKQNKWLKVSHVFENYQSGLRKITFFHGGMDQLFWAGHYGSKMAGACICVKIPLAATHIHNNELDTSPVLDE